MKKRIFVICFIVALTVISVAGSPVLAVSDSDFLGNSSPFASMQSQAASGDAGAPTSSPAPETVVVQQPAEIDIATTTGSNVVIRDKASSKGKQLVKVAKKGTVLTLLSKELVSKDWYNVSYNNIEGYVSKKYVKIGTMIPEIVDITLDWARPADAPAVSVSAEEQEIWNAIPSKIADAQAKNSDTIGWIRVPNLTGADHANSIDYPILIYSDNDYYLKRDFNKNKKTGGSIYMDYRNGNPRDRKHIVVYGHNMQKSKSDFNYLHNYKKKDFFDAAKVIRMDAFGMSEWEVFSCFETKADSKYIRTAFNTNKSFLEYCESLASQSMHKTNMTFSPTDQILTLVTCDNDTSNDKYRFFVHYRRIK